MREGRRRKKERKDKNKNKNKNKKTKKKKKKKNLEFFQSHRIVPTMKLTHSRDEVGLGGAGARGVSIAVIFLRGGD